MKKFNMKVILAAVLLLVTLIMLPSLAAAQDNVVRITCGNLNVRKGPGTQYSIVKVLRYNTRLYTYGSSGNWLNIGSGQWIYGGYTASSQPVKAVAVTVKTSLNVRSGPGTNYSIVGKFYAGNVTDVLESRNGWCRIDNSRWISEYYTVPLSNKKLGWYY
ncbi:MAG: SH3 domain-containing protein, partial [Eubacteriales bacterium]|nr:SH3 domain-containing protein [Eubacteriales bacterium]